MVTRIEGPPVGVKEEEEHVAYPTLVLRGFYFYSLFLVTEKKKHVKEKNGKLMKRALYNAPAALAS